MTVKIFLTNILLIKIHLININITQFKNCYSNYYFIIMLIIKLLYLNLLFIFLNLLYIITIFIFYCFIHR